MTTIFSLPKGPTKNRLFQLIDIILNPLKLFDTCRKDYGKTFTLRLLGQPDRVVISDPAHLKQVFFDTTDKLSTGVINARLLRPVLGDYSLLTLDGKKHLQHKRLLLPKFHGKRVKVYGEIMSKVVKERVLDWKEGSHLILTKEARTITFNIIMCAVFGINEENTRFKVLTRSMIAFIEICTTPFSQLTLLTPLLQKNVGCLTPWAKIIKIRRELDDILFAEIAERKKMPLADRTDILSILLDANDENKLSDQEIRDELLTLLIAGHDTTSIGISWVFYGILANPNVHKKVLAELNECVKTENDLISNLDKLVYLDAVIKEALRITPVAPFVVHLTNDTYQLGDYTLPKGTIVSPCIYLLHRDPDNWDEPHKFMPERFLDISEKLNTYFPFGSGIRRCLGSALALYEIKIFVAQVLLNADVALENNYTPKLKRRGVNIVPSQGVPIIVKKIYPRL